MPGDADLVETDLRQARAPSPPEFVAPRRAIRRNAEGVGACGKNLGSNLAPLAPEYREREARINDKPPSKLVRQKAEVEEFPCPAQFILRMRLQSWSSTTG
jgi:hypothetical protein